MCNIDFIKCISSVEKSQFEFLTLTYDHLIYDNIIEKILISFRPNQHYLNETKQIQDEHNYDNNLSAGIFGSSKNKLVDSEIINNIVIDNGDAQQHDLYNNDTKIGNYKCSISNQYEIWYVYCDITYINNNKLMEMNIKRWNTSDYSSIWHTIQYCHESTTTFIHSPNISTIRSYTCLNRHGIFNMIVKVNLSSKTIENNLHMYPIPVYFNPVFRFKKIENQGIKLNINNNILTDQVVVENNDTMGFHILSFHYDNSKLSIIMHFIVSLLLT